MVAAPAEDTPRHDAYLVIILDEQDRLGALQRRGRISLSLGLDGRIHAREVDLERRSLSHLAVDPDAPPALLNDAEDSRKPQPGALTALLGREERLEDPREGCLLDAGAGVGHREHDVRACFHAEMSLRIRFVEND